jgi:predicted secreted protein
VILRPDYFNRQTVIVPTQLEVASKPQIRFKDNATMGLRWGFETTSTLNITHEEEIL